MITLTRLREVLHYDPATGVFTWLKTLSKRRSAGLSAGSLRSDGYIVIKIDDVRTRAHRFAWLYMTGAFPKEQIDHINGVRNDNRWCNLRAATRAQNLANARLAVTNTSGMKGASWHRAAQKWHAQIRVDGRRIHIGLFDTAQDAHAAYMAKARELHGSFARAH
jgi:hypothetical protein